MAVLNAFNGIFTIILLIGVGLIAARGKMINQNIYNFCSKFLMKFCVPALLFENALRNVTWEFLDSMGIMLLIPFAVQFLNYGLAMLASLVFKVKHKDRGVFIAIFAVSNSIFIGLPVTLAIYGELSVPFVTACFIANIVCFWGLIVPGIARDGGAPTVTLRQKVTQVFSPPLIAFLFGCALNLIGIAVPSFITSAASYLGGVVTPLSMILIAFLLFTMGKNAFVLSRSTIIATIGRFVVAPTVCIIICLIAQVPADIAKVFVIITAMPVMNQAVILAGVYKANDYMAAQALAFTCIMSIVTIPLYVFLLELIFI